jgi:diguanylate cyclase (GGDEF)-like protein/PAS domain S-box-containing protein
MRPRWVWVYVAAGLVASGLHWRIADEVVRAVAWDALAVLAVAAAWFGVSRNRPDPALPWRLLAAGLTLLVAGDIAWDVSVYVFGHSQDSVPLSDVIYLSAYPFFAAGLVALARERAPTRDALVDGLVVALVIAAPLWQLVVRPTIDSTHGTAWDQVVTVAYPMLDCVLLVAVAYTVFTLTRWNTSMVLLLAGLVITTVADIVYARLSSLGILDSSLWLDPLWPASYTVMAAACLHPSMRWVSEGASSGRDRLDRARVMLLAISLLAVPVMLALNVGSDSADGDVVLGILSIAIAGLVGWRLVRLVNSSNRAYGQIATRESRFRAFLAHASEAITVSDVRGRFVYVSPSVMNLLGRAPEELLGKTMFDFAHPDDREIVAKLGRDVARHPGATVVAEARASHADGGWRWLEATSTNLVDDPNIRGFVSNFRDITAERRTSLLDLAARRALEGIARGEPLRVTLGELIAAADTQLDDAVCALHLAATNGTRGGSDTDDPRDVVAVAARTDLPEQWCVPILAADARRVGTLTVHRAEDRAPDPEDVAAVERIAALTAVAVDRAAAEDRLEYQAFHDPLTGLPNRTLLLDRLGQALLRLARSPGEVAVLFLDVDRFKVINDSLGHDAGDELLVEIAGRIERSLQAADTVARFGGDEFVVVCERLRGESDARAVAERLARTLAEPVTLSHGGAVVTTTSIGIALARGPHDRPEALLRDADTAMYRAKERGRARTEVFDPTLRSHVVVRLETERALRHALERNELRLLYQPAVRLSDGELVGAEALLRWRHPARGLLGPHEFIDVAEETGLIVEMGDWVIEQACAELARERVVRPDGPVVLSVNLSGRQLARPELVEGIHRHLDVAGIPPSLLCLEVTESVLLDDVEASVAALHALKDVGVRLAVDDFGTGYSSLGYLKQFPFDQLKIDRAFVAGLGSSDADDAIVLAAVQMAHALGMEVVAEGVETEQQRDRARDLGCDLAQGFLFAPPGRAEDLLGRAPLSIVESAG